LDVPKQPIRTGSHSEKGPPLNKSGVIKLSSPIVRSARTLQMSGMFDVPPMEISSVEIPYNIDLSDRQWNIGLLVGPSGSGKSSILKQVFGYHDPAYEWSYDKSVLDMFPKGMPVTQIVELLCSVGFSSPPAWMRPYYVLSMGEQFRVSIARGLAETITTGEMPYVVDEFTSVVDRTVAQIGSSAIARTVRKRGLQMIAATCHYDVVDWLQPDWVFDTQTSVMSWRFLQRRPDIHLTVKRVHHSLWPSFARHHYLSAGMNEAAVCFAAFIKDRPIAFNGWLTQPHRSIPNLKRSSRIVTLPDFQGVGIGNTLNELVASMWRALGFRAMITTSHPSVVSHCTRSAKWNNHRGASRNRGGGMMDRDALGATIAIDRLTAGFEYVGPVMDRALARQLHDDRA
jgi:ABC-type ATPase involved in cell division